MAKLSKLRTPLLNSPFPSSPRSVHRLLLSLGIGILVSQPGSAADSFATDSGSLQIKPLVHASVELEHQGLVLQIDPWGALGTEAMQAADLIIVTDSPGHHLDTEAIAAIRKPGASVVTPANGAAAIPDGIVMEIGDLLQIKSVTVEAIAAYDIIPGAPEHPRGDANGYVITIGGKRLFFAGVTECVDEVRALEDIDIAFMPMNIPVGRMTPEAAAECTQAIGPDVVYTYHYDQDWVRRLANPDYPGSELPEGITVEESLDHFAEHLLGTGIEYRRADWYPEPR